LRWDGLLPYLQFFGKSAFGSSGEKMNSNAVNNQFYDTLGGDWWNAKDHMVVFLRAESKIKLAYLKQFVPNLGKLKILDIGAGAGFVSMPLAKLGAEVTALDYSEESLEVLSKKAKEEGLENKIKTVQADAIEPLPFGRDFDLVMAFDVLEHVGQPKQLIQNAAACLKPSGIFAYHTLNRSFWCWLLYLQIVPRLIKRDPGDVHKHKFNIKPTEMQHWIGEAGMKASDQIGIEAPFWQPAIWELVKTGVLSSELNFRYTPDLSLGYLGLATF
jgi:2-polyprenyl-6-hydroxyphenyl methylase / 3-demethylubiquinone-9 3-methyltransferase